MPLVFPTTQLAIEDVTTCVWIRDTEAYRQWYSLPEAPRPLLETAESDASSRALLFITGESMTGKSTLLRFITETFGDRGSIQAEQITRLVHICDENILCSRMPNKILKSLIWQLLEEHPHLYINICHQYPKAPASFDELGLVFIRLLLDVSCLVLITIDNLECAFGGDVCETAIPGASELVPLLEQLASVKNVKILTTCISPRFKLCHEVDLSNFGQEQESALTNFSRAEMEKHTVFSLRSRNIREGLRARLCAASHGSFLRVLIGICLLSSVRKEDDFDAEVKKYEKSDTSSLLADIGSQNTRQVAILAACKEAVSLEELAIISGSLGPREDLDKSLQSKSFVELLALKSLDAAAEFAALEGIFFHIRNGLYYPNTRLVARVMSTPSNQSTLKSWSQSLADLCVATLDYYSVSVGTEILEDAAPLCQHSSITDEEHYRLFYPLLTYAVRHWIQYVYECDRIPIVLGGFLKKQQDFARIAAALSEDVYKRFSDIDQLQSLESWIARHDKATKSIPAGDNSIEVDAALAEAGLRKDHRAVRGLLDSYHQMLYKSNFKELFSDWIRDAVKSDDPKTAVFPLEILDLSRGKEPSQLDICFDHEQELHHLFPLAIKNKYWGVADGIWTALTESATLNWSKWIKMHGNELLYEAVRSGNCSIVTALVDREVPSDYASPDGITLLQIAAAMGVEDIIEVLTATATGTREEFNQSGVDDVDTKDDDASEVDSQLSENPPVQSCRQTALMVASASGFVDIVRLLLNASWDVDDRDYVDNGDAEGRSALHFAVLFGHEAVVNELLLAGARIEQRDILGRTPMHMAAAGNWDGLIELLCKQGASAGTKDKQGLTPLHVAAYNGSTRAASRLVQRAPASVHKRDKKNITPLHAAAEYGSESITRLLLENRAPCDAPTKDGNTPLHLAARTKHPSDALLQLLLGKSKDPQGKNKQGLTPSEVALKHGNSLLLERLRASERRHSPVQEEALYNQVLSQTPFSIFRLQVEKLSNSTAAQNLRAGNPDHYLSRAIEDLRKATDSVGAEHGRLGPDAIWNSTGVNYEGRSTRERQFRPPTPTT
jgi:ankyrin repeat protein